MDFAQVPSGRSQLRIARPDRQSIDLHDRIVGQRIVQKGHVSGDPFIELSAPVSATPRPNLSWGTKSRSRLLYEVDVHLHAPIRSSLRRTNRADAGQSRPGSSPAKRKYRRTTGTTVPASAARIVI